MSSSQTLANLRAAAPAIAPSLLSCDFARLGEEIRRVEQAGAKLLHLDIMDGHFVPNLSFGIPVVEAIRRCTELPLDVHLMISEPGRYVKRFRDAGADLLTIHIETVSDPHSSVERNSFRSLESKQNSFRSPGSERTEVRSTEESERNEFRFTTDVRALLSEIRAMGAGVGISLNPPTPVDSLNGCLDLCDLVLVMSVMPGFGGQRFDPVALEKLRYLRAVGGPQLLLSIDGGVNAETIESCAAAGADLFVTGSALFNQPDFGRFLKQMTGLAKSAKEVRV
jgi:ribulose-phosphate 3-epimerase